MALLKIFKTALFSGPLIAISLMLAGSPVADADTYAYNPAYLISDNIFTDYGSMNASQIQSFLSSEGSGLTNYSELEDCGSTSGSHYSYYATYYQCGSTESAAQIIYDASQAYQINPRSILATIQKEQSLVTDPDPTQSDIDCAMGYLSCESGYNSFFSQIDNGTWQFRYDIEGIEGQSSWNGWSNMNSWYASACGSATSLYSNGIYPGNTVTFNDPGGTAETITIGDDSTAALYCYTPYVGPYSQTGYSGSYNFVISFEEWWGSVSSPCYNANNLSGVISGEHVVADGLGINNSDNLTMVQANNTGSACMEAYIWQNDDYNQWLSLTASALPVFNPATSSIVSADLTGSGTDQLYLIDYTGTASGRLEVHGLSSDLQTWTSHVATVSGTISHNDAEVIACDPDGYGYDNLFLVEYRNTTSGDIEIHEFSQNLQQWVNHWDIHYSAVSPQNDQIICGDFNGSGKDAFYLVQYNGTASGRLEIHGGISNLGYDTPWPYSSPTQWPVQTATISGPRVHWEDDTAASTDDTDFIAADTVGDGVDTPYIIQYANTASGKVEIYALSNDFKSWSMLTVTNQGAYAN